MHSSAIFKLNKGKMKRTSSVIIFERKNPQQPRMKMHVEFQIKLEERESFQGKYFLFI